MAWGRDMSSSDREDDESDVEDARESEDGVLLANPYSSPSRNAPPMSRKGRRSIIATIIFSVALVFCFWIAAKLIPRVMGRSRLSSAPAGPKRALIIASYAEQNVTWLKDVPAGWQIYRYIASTNNGDVEGSGDSRRITTLPLPLDSGREAMAYLTFIIDHYELSLLPSYMVFMHGHDRAWHQPERSVDKLRALNLTALGQHGYVPIRCSYDPICAPERHFDLAAGPESIVFDNLKPLPALWEMCFDVTRDKLPTRLASPRGAQFAVTAEAVRAQPLEFWKRVRAPLMERDLSKLEARLRDKTLSVWGSGDGNDTNLFGNNSTMTNEDLASMYEKMWHVLFGKHPVTCLTERECRGTVYANALACSRYEATPSQDWENVACAVDQDALKTIKLENDALLRGERH